MLRADLIRGVSPRRPGADTWQAYAQRWLDGYAGSNGTRVYIQRVINAMAPYIGAVPLVEIRATDLAAAYRDLENGTRQAPSTKRAGTGLATSTVVR
ncbi:MAG: hypothetical protein JWN68_2142 [Nocardioides sp.]|nr:hypothetical protein [Nocardioides sp.]